MHYSNFQTHFGLNISIPEIILVIWRFSYICIILRPLVVEGASIVYKIMKDFERIDVNSYLEAMENYEDYSDTSGKILKCKIIFSNMKRFEYFRTLMPRIFSLEV